MDSFFTSFSSLGLFLQIDIPVPNDGLFLYSNDGPYHPIIQYNDIILVVSLLPDTCSIRKLQGMCSIRLRKNSDANNISAYSRCTRMMPTRVDGLNHFTNHLV